MNKRHDYIHAPWHKVYLMFNQKLPHKHVRYQKVHKIDEGGISEIYLAKYSIPPASYRWVALKALKPRFAKSNEFINQLEREAQLAASLNHDNIVQIYDFDHRSIIMEYVQGLHLKYILNCFTNGIPANMAIYILLRVADALKYAHQKNILHLDIKPQNILVSLMGGIKITDFGVARALSDCNSSEYFSGTLNYMAPEQLMMEELDTRTDIYSLGLIMIEMLTGQPVHSYKSILHARQMINHGTNIHSKCIPEELYPVISKCLSNDLSKRYQSMNHFFIDLLERQQQLPSFDRFQMAAFMKKEFLKKRRNINDKKK